MTISDELFMSIMALDAYNHGYNAGVSMTEGDGLGTATYIGHRPNSDIGFYAIAYNWNGNKVISYRGTDNWNPLSLAGAAAGASDWWTGWSIGAEFASATSRGHGERSGSVSVSDGRCKGGAMRP